MGGTQSSESMVSMQSITNEINNISNENCIQTCTSKTSDVSVILEGSTIRGDINISSYCSIMGSSCSLKASLTTDLHNTQKTKQAGTLLDEQDPLCILGDLFGDSASITENSNESIANRVTNILNSICQQQSSSTTEDINVELVNDNVIGNINITSGAQVSKTNCIIDNMARTTIANDQTTDQSEKLLQGSPLLFAIIGIVILVVIIMIGIVILGVGGLGTAGVLGVGYLAVENSKNKRAYGPPGPMYGPPSTVYVPPVTAYGPPVYR